MFFFKKKNINCLCSQHKDSEQNCLSISAEGRSLKWLTGDACANVPSTCGVYNRIFCRFAQRVFALLHSSIANFDQLVLIPSSRALLFKKKGGGIAVKFSKLSFNFGEGTLRLSLPCIDYLTQFNSFKLSVCHPIFKLFCSDYGPVYRRLDIGCNFAKQARRMQTAEYDEPGQIVRQSGPNLEINNLKNHNYLSTNLFVY